MIEARTPAIFPLFRFAGTHRQVGRQFGEACAAPIRRHLEFVLARLARHPGLGRADALARALLFRPSVLQHAPHFDEEIQGVAEGAGLTLAEAYLLQLRAELASPLLFPEPSSPAEGCTSFAVLGGATADGSPLAGQNDDLPAFYAEVGVVVHFSLPDAPAVIMFTAAGQVSHIGMNDRGLVVCTNYLLSDGWRVGFPRSLLPRVAFQHATVADAVAAVDALPRAASRNYLLADARGAAVSLETTPTRSTALAPVDGVLAHTNHYVAAPLLEEERSTGRSLANSQRRLARMQELLAAGRSRLDVAALQTILRDRAGVPDALCRAPGDEDGDAMTAASLIAEPAARRLWLAAGPPNLHPYTLYEFHNGGFSVE